MSAHSGHLDGDGLVSVLESGELFVEPGWCAHVLNGVGRGSYGSTRMLSVSTPACCRFRRVCSLPVGLLGAFSGLDGGCGLCWFLELFLGWLAAGVVLTCRAWLLALRLSCWVAVWVGRVGPGVSLEGRVVRWLG